MRVFGKTTMMVNPIERVLNFIREAIDTMGSNDLRGDWVSHCPHTGEARWISQGMEERGYV